MPKNAHLTFDERLTIETALKEACSFREIAALIGKDPSTVSKEVRNHITIKTTQAFNPCSHRNSCDKNRTACKKCIKPEKLWGPACKKCTYAHCYKQCPDFSRVECPKIKKPPYVCNGCDRRLSCKQERYLYVAKTAQKEYEHTRSESRQGFDISASEVARLDAIITPLIKQGHSVHQICVNNADLIMLDEKTIYTYIDAGLFSVGNIDLPRKVHYRARKKKKPVRVDKKCHIGRTYEDFLEYIEANNESGVVEMDSVEGRKGGKVFLTLYFRDSSVMLAFIRDNNTARSVTEIINQLYLKLGHDRFVEMFPVILADRGSEFTDPLSIEFSSDGKRRTHVFYCEPNRPDQKGGCEVTHEMIRRILPKRTSFDNLTQADISLMMSHINSYKRKKLNNRSANQLFSFLHGEDTLSMLDIQSIPVNEINLTPNLLKK